MRTQINKCYCHFKEGEGDQWGREEIPDGYCCFCSRCNRPGHIRLDESGTVLRALCDSCARRGEALNRIKILGVIVIVLLTLFFRK